MMALGKIQPCVVRRLSEGNGWDNRSIEPGLRRAAAAIDTTTADLVLPMAEPAPSYLDTRPPTSH